MKNVLLALLLVTGSSAFAQVNYVRNPSLEDYSQCPTGYDQIVYANFWSAPDSNYSYPSPCFPDYYNTCTNPNSAAGVPANPYFWQYPRTGNGFAEVQMFYDEAVLPYDLHRDYLQGRLYKKLIAGKSYCVKFYVNYEEASGYAIKDIGAYLDNGNIDTTQTCGQPQTRYTPQVSNTGGIITDTAGWIKIEGSFIAKGNEQFITIGNFKDKAHTTYIATPVDPNFPIGPSSWSWYLVDDVSVIESDLSADAGADRHIGKGDSTYIGRPKEVGLECTWSVLGSTAVMGTGAGIWVKPQATTSYVVTQTLCGQVKKDAVRVEVWAAGVGSINGKSGQGYTLSPNPNNGAFELSQSFANDETLQASVSNVLGQQVYHGEVHFKEGKAGIQTDVLRPGIYFLKLQNAIGHAWTLRFVRE